MTEEYIPKTIAELESWMKQHCFNFNGYSINGNMIYEGCGIDSINGQFAWYYTERGQKSNLAYFATENEIVAHAFQEIQSDKWAKTHCVGFTANEHLHKELENILEAMHIEYMQDKIPYYGLEKPVFRTFVFGCDINKARHLTGRFCTEK